MILGEFHMVVRIVVTFIFWYRHIRGRTVLEKHRTGPGFGRLSTSNVLGSCLDYGYEKYLRVVSASMKVSPEPSALIDHVHVRRGENDLAYLQARYSALAGRDPSTCKSSRPDCLRKPKLYK